jgi:hypothetical protein
LKNSTSLNKTEKGESKNYWGNTVARTGRERKESKNHKGRSRRDQKKCRDLLGRILLLPKPNSSNKEQEIWLVSGSPNIHACIGFLLEYTAKQRGYERFDANSLGFSTSQIKRPSRSGIRSRSRSFKRWISSVKNNRDYGRSTHTTQAVIESVAAQLRKLHSAENGEHFTGTPIAFYLEPTDLATVQREIAQLTVRYHVPAYCSLLLQHAVWMRGTSILPHWTAMVQHHLLCETTYAAIQIYEAIARVIDCELHYFQSQSSKEEYQDRCHWKLRLSELHSKVLFLLTQLPSGFEYQDEFNFGIKNFHKATAQQNVAKLELFKRKLEKEIFRSTGEKVPQAPDRFRLCVWTAILGIDDRTDYHTWFDLTKSWDYRVILKLRELLAEISPKSRDLLNCFTHQVACCPQDLSDVRDFTKRLKSTTLINELVQALLKLKTMTSLKHLDTWYFAHTLLRCLPVPPRKVVSFIMAFRAYTNEVSPERILYCIEKLPRTVRYRVCRSLLSILRREDTNPKNDWSKREIISIFQAQLPQTSSSTFNPLDVLSAWAMRRTRLQHLKLPSSVESTPTISRLLRQIASDQQRLGVTPHIPRRITKRLSRIEEKSKQLCYLRSQMETNQATAAQQEKLIQLSALLSATAAPTSQQIESLLKKEAADLATLVLKKILAMYYEKAWASIFGDSHVALRFSEKRKILAWISQMDSQVLERLMVIAKAWREAGSDYKTHNQANTAWVRTAIEHGLQIEGWLTPPSSPLQIGSQQATLCIRSNPFDTFLMGSRFGSCLSIDSPPSSSSFSVLPNAMDANKHVLWIISESGHVIARQLIGINTAMELLTYRVYINGDYAQSKEQIRTAMDEYCLTLARDCNTHIAARGKPSSLQDWPWHNDGPRPLAGINLY